MTNATNSSAQSPRARGGPHLRRRLDTIAAVMLAAPAVLLMIMSARILANGPNPGLLWNSFFYGLSSLILVGGSLLLILAVGIARHRREAEILGALLCAAITAISLLFLPVAGEWPVVAGMSAPAGVTAILLLVALRQKPNPGGSDGSPSI